MISNSSLYWNRSFWRNSDNQGGQEYGDKPWLRLFPGADARSVHTQKYPANVDVLLDYHISAGCSADDEQLNAIREFRGGAALAVYTAQLADIEVILEWIDWISKELCRLLQLLEEYSSEEETLRKAQRALPPDEPLPRGSNRQLNETGLTITELRKKLHGNITINTKSWKLAREAFGEPPLTPDFMRMGVEDLQDFCVRLRAWWDLAVSTQELVRQEYEETLNPISESLLPFFVVGGLFSSEEGRLIFFTEVKQLQTDGPHVIAEPGVLDARMQLTHVQPAQQQGFATDAALKEYLASAGLTLRDVPFDGDCWLSVVAPYITCADGRPCHQVQWSGVKFFTVKLREALVEYINTNPTWSDGSGRRPEWLNDPEFISDLHEGKAHSDEHSFLVLASMAKRVLQVYRIFPTREEVLRRKWPTGVNHKNLVMPDCDNAIYGQYAPFSMQYFCPPPEEPLTSNEPIRILHMLEVPLYDPKLPADDQTWVTYPGHFMRILTEEAAGKEKAEMERLRKGKRVTRSDGAPGKKSKKPFKPSGATN
ncbi:hypothetical protein CYMTET_26253 [Cymbomonas tetramitiformis]|uniref:Uncharacterized protein n=1 Tax=Cymbomonas tetramitiformis TaxID=36881 RepID=A0AAE0KY41_9CHLO|nr:hypothetical protein CYMTET_26253 [Cymbomonas tetramitiformis]